MERGGTDKAAERRFVPDARMVGKWYKAERGETINIFPEEPLRMKMSFSSSGHCNFTPNCVYADGDALCWESTKRFSCFSFPELSKYSLSPLAFAPMKMTALCSACMRKS